MKIYFNRPIKEHAWGGGSHFITNLYYFLKDKMDIVFDYSDDIDAIFMFEPKRDKKFLGIEEIKKIKKQLNIPVIQRINDTDIARHAYGLSPHDPPWREKLFLYANQFVDHTVFISDWVKDHYTALGYQKGDRSDSVIVNGCNQKYFFPSKEKKKVKNKIKVITHHWSDNLMKGADVYSALDQVIQGRSDIEFTYLGRYPKVQYQPRRTKIIPPKYGAEIGDILRDHDVYVTGARFEACGMHHIEAASCGLPVIYHKDGGAIPSICSKYGREFDSLETLIEALEYFKDNKKINSAISNIDYSFLSQERCNNAYLQVIMKVINK